MQQVIEIHIGWDPAPFLEIGFGITMGIIRLRKQKKTNMWGVRCFGNTFRFIDDIIALNGCGEFERSFRTIYAPELELKIEKLSYLEGPFADLMITIKDKKLY